jgi:hypothetical protein
MLTDYQVSEFLPRAHEEAVASVFVLQHDEDDDQAPNGRREWSAYDLALSFETDLAEAVECQLPGPRIAGLDLNAYVAAVGVRGDDVEMRDITCECGGDEVSPCQFGCDEVLTHLRGKAIRKTRSVPLRHGHLRRVMFGFSAGAGDTEPGNEARSIGEA